MTAIFALPLVGLVLAAPLPYYRSGLPWPAAAAVSMVTGGLLAALGGILAPYIPLPAMATATAWAVVCWAGFFFLARKFPLPRHGAVRSEPLSGRLAGFALLALLGALLFVFLWANLVHPPILAETLFRWSGPARGLGPVFGFPLRLSAFYYALAHTDVGWKWLWSALSLFPLFATGAMLHAHSRGLAAAAGGMAAGALSFSFLFWGSSGQPELFLAGVVIALYWSARTPWAGWASVLWPAAAVLAWSGAFWGALAVPGLLISATRKDSLPALRAVTAIAALFLLAQWSLKISPDWRLWNDIVVYFARDAWNIARYGPLTYLIFAYFLRTARLDRSFALTTGSLLATLAIFVVDLSAREAPSSAILLHVAGNRLSTCVLLIAWFAVVVEEGQTQAAVDQPASGRGEAVGA